MSAQFSQTETPNANDIDPTSIHLTPSLYGIKIGSPHHPKAADSLQKMWMYRIDPSKYFGLFQGYIRQDWKTHIEHEPSELRTQWIDILFDLIFVACVVHISQEAYYSIPAYNNNDNCNSAKYDFVFTVFPQFGILSLFWMEHTMIATHFEFNQASDQMLKLFYFCFVLTTGLFVYNSTIYHIAFQCSYFMVRTLSFFIYFKAYLIPRAKYYALWHLIQTFLIILALIFCIIYVRNACAMTYFFIHSAFFLFEFFSFCAHWLFLKFALPVHVAHISERFGLFVMLILGEALISIITSHVGTFRINGLIQILFISLVFIMCYFIAKLYFECQPNEESIMSGTHNHALRTSPCMRILYICSHQMLFFALLGYGIGLKIAFSHFADDEKEWIDVALPAYSLVLIVISLNIERLSHPQRMHLIQVWVFRILLVGIMFFAPIIMKEMNEGFVFFVLLSCVILLNLVDIEGKKMKKKHQKMEKENLLYFKMREKKKSYDSLGDAENRICLDNVSLCMKEINNLSNEDQFDRFLMMLKFENENGAKCIELGCKIDRECMLREYENAQYLVSNSLIEQAQIASLLISKSKLIISRDGT